jgi:ketosteroid isomerase-like protein
MAVKTTIEAFIRAVQTSDESAFGSLFTPDATWRITPAHSIDAAPLASQLFGSVKAFTNVLKTWTFEPFNTIILENEGKAVMEARAKGEPRTADEASYLNEVIMFFEVEGGKIRCLREYLADGAAATAVAKKM